MRTKTTFPNESTELVHIERGQRKTPTEKSGPNITKVMTSELESIALANILLWTKNENKKKRLKNVPAAEKFSTKFSASNDLQKFSF